MGKRFKKFFQLREGFTLLEIIITVGVLSTVSVVGFVTLSNFNRKKVLDTEMEIIVSALRAAKQKALGQEEARAWGVRFSNPTEGGGFYVVFSGDALSTGDVRDRHKLPRELQFLTPTAGNVVDVVFTKSTGIIGENRIIDVGLKSGEGNYRIIIYSNGRIEKIRNGHGLVGYWKFDDPTNSTLARDWGGSDLNGTVTGAIAGAAGQIGRAFSYDGNDLISVSDDTLLQLTGDLTIAAWVKDTLNGTGSYGIAGKMKYNTYNGYGITKQGRYYKFWTAANNVSTYTVSKTTYNDTNWHQIIGVRKDGVNYLYVDGKLQNMTENVPIADSGQNFIVGRYYSNVSNYYWTGVIDEVKVWNRGLSAEEVQEIYLEEK